MLQSRFLDGEEDELNPRRFRTLFISDVHLGSRGAQVDRLLDFLRALTPEPKRDGDDPIKEAQRAGDLIAGEGLQKVERESRRERISSLE